MKRRRLVKSCITRRKRCLENVDIVLYGNFSLSGGERGVYKIQWCGIGGVIGNRGNE